MRNSVGDMRESHSRGFNKNDRVVYYLHEHCVRTMQVVKKTFRGEINIHAINLSAVHGTHALNSAGTYVAIASKMAVEC